MRRTQVQLDEETYEALRRAAFQRRQSLSATLRDLLRTALDVRRRTTSSPGAFRFVGAFASGKVNRTSEEHDRVLGEAPW